jgi:peptidoglycan/LPS O-acetylase OafA/YrhL
VTQLPDSLFDGKSFMQQHHDDPMPRPTRDWHGHRTTESVKRPDIQGLRCIAVVLVILFHAGVTSMPGGYVGVDVFFVISGFLITGTIVRDLDHGGFSLSGFYANRARRLLPAAFVTIAATCLVTYLVLPGSRFASIGRDALASAFYFVNWRLSRQSVDYLSQNQAPSPFQHFWSLAVEEQFYILWPLLLIIAAAIGQRFGRRRIAFLIALAAVFVPSLAYSISYTSSDAAQAYFVTPTRMWELALGGGIALAATVIAIVPKTVAAVLGWAGLAAIMYAATQFAGASLFPGSAALLPTIGAAAVLATGQRGGRLGPALLLHLPPLTFVGDISYSLYLWHWPLIVFAASQFAGPLPVWAGLVAGFGAIVPAAVSRHLIELPGMYAPRFATNRNGLGLGLLATVSSGVAALFLIASVPNAQRSGITVSARGIAKDINGRTIKVGAEVLGLHPAKSVSAAVMNSYSSITPTPVDAASDLPDGNRACTTLLYEGGDVSCVYGDPSGSVTVDLVGDSHAEQWLPGFDAAGIANHWRIVTHLRQYCAMDATPITFQGRAFTQCTQWNSDIERSIPADNPRVVVVTASRDQFPFLNGAPVTGTAGTRELARGYERAWSTLTAAGIHVVVLAQTPIPNFDVPGCVEQHANDLSACARSASMVLSTSNALAQAARATVGVTYVNMSPILCPNGTECPAVIGGVLVYRDASHLTATYARTAAGYITGQLRRLAG